MKKIILISTLIVLSFAMPALAQTEEEMKMKVAETDSKPASMKERLDRLEAKVRDLSRVSDDHEDRLDDIENKLSQS